MKSPAFQFYPTDYLGSMRVQMMTCEEEGIYIRLLLYCWQNGSIPSDREKLRRLIAKPCSDSAIATVALMFRKRGENLMHERLDAERKKQQAWREKSSSGGKKSRANAEKTRTQVHDVSATREGWLQNGANQNPTLRSPSPSPSSSPITPAPDPQARAGENPEDRQAAESERRENTRTLPAALNTAPFRLAFGRWRAHWSEAFGRGSMPLATIDAHLGVCTALGHDRAIAAINFTIERGTWKTIAEPREPVNGSAGGSVHESLPASLGALQMQLKRTEDEMEGILYPGGSAWKTIPTGEKLTRFTELKTQRDAIKTRIANIDHVPA